MREKQQALAASRPDVRRHYRDIPCYSSQQAPCRQDLRRSGAREDHTNDITVVVNGACPDISVRGSLHGEYHVQRCRHCDAREHSVWPRKHHDLPVDTPWAQLTPSLHKTSTNTTMNCRKSGTKRPHLRRPAVMLLPQASSARGRLCLYVRRRRCPPSLSLGVTCLRDTMWATPRFKDHEVHKTYFARYKILCLFLLRRRAPRNTVDKARTPPRRRRRARFRRPLRHRRLQRRCTARWHRRAPL